MYKEYYHLSHNPFQMIPDSRMFYTSKGHKRALSYLQQGLNQDESFILMTGDEGTGKSTVIKKLVADMNPKNYIIKELVTSHGRDLDLMKMICDTFELMSSGLNKASLLNQFIAFLNSVNKLGRRIVLIVDEVQNLPAKIIQELRMLANFKVKNRPIIQTLLIAQSEFVKTLQDDSMKQIRQLVTTSCQLCALKIDDIKYYINYRLEKAGKNKEDLFDEQAIVLIYELTEGIPRRINVFCDRILLFGFLEDVTFFTQEHIYAVAEELSDEISSPIKLPKHAEDNSHLHELQQTYTQTTGPVVEKTPIPIKKKNIDFNKNVQAASNKSKENSITEEFTADFVDIEETIKSFEDQIGKEIEEFRKSIKEKN